MTLTETYAMLPASSVSGVFLHHPQSRYFSIGRIGRDQAEDYAVRKDLPLAEVERWLLSPNLGYEPGCRGPLRRVGYRGAMRRPCHVGAMSRF